MLTYHDNILFIQGYYLEQFQSQNFVLVWLKHGRVMVQITCLILTAKVRKEKIWFPLGYSYKISYKTKPVGLEFCLL